ncbi:transposase [Azospirillum soli]|nr:transposase [Azospirillum soli]
MLTVETIGRIRREFFVKGKGIKEIARDLQISRNTVRKVLRSGATTFTYEREVQPMPKLGRWTAELEEMLAGNASKPARERLTLIHIFETLRERGYTGGYDAVRRYARRWRTGQAKQTINAHVPLTFAPGEAYQFDWSHEIVVLNGTTTPVKVAHLRLCHSRMMCVRAYPRESQEMVFDAHDRAFAFFRGTCTRGIYDNMKTAVDAVFVGKERAFNRRFAQMCAHHLVEPVACTPAAGWEKGQVENQVGLVRERFFTPRLRFKSYDEMNAWLLDRCVAHAKARGGARVRFYTAVDLVNRLEAEARGGRQGRLADHLARLDLLVLDELGYLPFAQAGGQLLFHLILRRYEKGAMLVTSNRAVGEWGSVFGDPVVATAILDRLLHHSHVITIRGDSYRLREKRRAGLLKTNPAPAVTENTL